MNRNIINFGALAALTLSLAVAGRAQTITIASVQGGSSALQGNFAPGSSFSEGAIPLIIATPSLAITNYKNAGQTDNKFLANNITVTDGTINETVSQAQIRYNTISGSGGAADIRVIVLLRSDSGFGVRYVSNRFYIKSWAAFTDTAGTAITPSASTTATVPQKIAQYLVTNANKGASSVEAIKTGLSDVSADTIVRYANFPNLNTAGLSGVKTRRLAVQTLLPLYNSSLNVAPKPTTQLSFSRADFQNLIKGATPRPYGIANVFYREQTSGTRNTQIIGVQVNYPGSTTGSPARLVYAPEAGGTINNGTGAILTSINSVVDSFSYAFVTGAAGDGKPQIRVGQYKGVSPFGSGTTAKSLPNNNGQAAYGNSPYYNNVLNGTYTLWAYAVSYTVPGATDATADSIQAQLNNLSNAAIVNKLGLIQPTALNTAPNNIDRSSFTSPYTGEQVTDGQEVGSTTTRKRNLAFPGVPQP